METFRQSGDKMKGEDGELSLLDFISYYESGPVLKERTPDVIRTSDQPYVSTFPEDYNYADDEVAAGKTLTRKKKLEKIQKKALGLTGIPGGSPPGAQGYRPRSSYEQQDFEVSHTTGFGGPSVIDVDEDKHPYNVSRTKKNKPINISYKTEANDFFSFLETGKLKRKRIPKVGAIMNTEQRELTKLAKALSKSGYKKQAKTIIKLASGFAPGALTPERADWEAAVTAASAVITSAPLSLSVSGTPDGADAADTHGAKAMFDTYIVRKLSKTKTRLEDTAAGGGGPCTSASTPVPCGLSAPQVLAIHSAVETAWKDLSIDSYTVGDLSNAFVDAFDLAKGSASPETGVDWMARIVALSDANLGLLADLKKKEAGGASPSTPSSSSSSSSSRAAAASMATLTDNYITDQGSGNDFRAWVNADPARLSKANAKIVADRTAGGKTATGSQGRLDPSGAKSSSWRNSYVRSAWSVLGEEYKTSPKGQANAPAGAAASPGAATPIDATALSDEDLIAYLKSDRRDLKARDALVKRCGRPPGSCTPKTMVDNFREYVEKAYVEDAKGDPFFQTTLGGGRRGSPGARRGHGGGVTPGQETIVEADYWVLDNEGLYVRKRDGETFFRSFTDADGKRFTPDKPGEQKYTLVLISSRDTWPLPSGGGPGYLTDAERKSVLKLVAQQGGSKQYVKALKKVLVNQKGATRGGIFNADWYRENRREDMQEARQDPSFDKYDPPPAPAAAHDHVLAAAGRRLRSRRLQNLRKKGF